MSAGCLFTDGTHVISRLEDRLTGLGGKAKFGEPVYMTAWRETLEELFNFDFDLDNIIYEIIKYTAYTVLMELQDYTCYVYTFKDLETILSMIRKHHVVSPYYRRFPRNIWELVSTRRGRFPLALLPFKKI